MSELDLRAALRPDLFEPAPFAELRRRLSSGALCIVRDAFRPELAERLHRSLAAIDDWQQRDITTPLVTYHNQTRPWARVPEGLHAFKQLFAAESSRRLVAELSGAGCDEPFDFNASLYRPGDYGLMHTDYGDGRTVSFIWYATQNWDPAWGGQLVWCEPTAFIDPTWNTLVIFRVTPRSYHFVTPVTAEARGRRLALNGWYLGRDARQLDWPRTSSWSLGPVDEIGPGLFASGGAR